MMMSKRQMVKSDKAAAFHILTCFTFLLNLWTLGYVTAS